MNVPVGSSDPTEKVEEIFSLLLDVIIQQVCGG
jgi:hypothetical protein